MPLGAAILPPTAFGDDMAAGSMRCFTDRSTAQRRFEHLYLHMFRCAATLPPLSIFLPHHTRASEDLW